MEMRNMNNLNNSSTLDKETDSNKSFVKKVKSHVSDLLSTSFGKWFTGDKKTNVRHRVYDEEDEEDEDSYIIQPPSKRVKMLTPESNQPYMNSISNDINAFSPISSNTQTNVSTNIFEPVAGPSGLQITKPIHNSTDLLNGDKDSDSGESEFSSLLRLKHSSNVDTPTSSHNRSLFGDRSLTPQLNSSLSSRRPSFNASTFGSPTFIDRTLSTKRILNSPFYNGRTIYGGASAYSSRQQRPTIEKPKTQIQVKPVNSSVGNDVSLSKTARRILSALEEFRSPVSDAKKIPYPSNRTRPEGILTKYTGANPYLNREHKIPLALNKELQVPTVPDLLKMKLKERLQDSTVAVRQIATTSKSVLNKDDYRIRNKEDEVPKHTNKMKTKITAIRQKNDNHTVEEVKLPEVSLPITTLPKFEFSLPPPPSSAKQPLITVACNESPKVSETITVTKRPEVAEVKDFEGQYKFSNPLILADNLISITAINDFKFSDPVFKQKNKTPPLPELINFKSSSSDTFTLKRKIPDVSQVHAKLSKDTVDKPESLDKFKPSVDLWECSTCLIRNSPENVKCCACEANKPVLKPTKSDNVISKPVNSLVEKFNLPNSTWECPTCLIRNKNEIEKCIACETVKPGVACKTYGFGEEFKKKDNEWECPLCMVRNNMDKTVCVACETPKPGVKPADPPADKKESICKFNFGIFPTTTKTAVVETTQASSLSTVASTFTFGIPTSQNPPSKESKIEPSVKVDDPKPIEQPVKEKPLETKPTEEIVKPPVSSSIFKFGATPIAPVVSTPTTATQSEPSKPIVLSPPTSAFTFATNPTAIKPSLKPETSDNKNSTAPSPITFEPPKINSIPKPAATTIPPLTSITQSDKNSFTIDKPVTTQPATSINFLFTTPQAPQPTVTIAPPTNNLFKFRPKTTASSLFGNTVTTTQAPIFKFSQSEQPNNPPAFGVTEKQPLPMFGSNTATPTIFGSTKSAFESPAPTQPFGSVAPSTFGTEVKPAITFGTDPKPSPIFGIEPKTSLFGAEQKAPLFGSEQTSVFGSEPKGSVFGSEQKAPSFGIEQKPTSVFGAEQKPPPAFGAPNVKPFSFGAPAQPTEDSSSKPTLFSFDQAVKSSETTKAFSFGAAPPPAAVGGFSFNSNPAPAFSFNAPKVENPLPFQSPSATTNIFNAAPVQPQQPIQNGGFNFGSQTNTNNNNNKTGFNFGATNQFSPAVPTPAAPVPWSIGGNTNPTPAPATGGFNFGQNPAQQAPAFNANMKPNFNFTAGNSPAGFSATVENSPVQRRRLKAVRRNNR